MAEIREKESAQSRTNRLREIRRKAGIGEFSPKAIENRKRKEAGLKPLPRTPRKPSKVQPGRDPVMKIRDDTMFSPLLEGAIPASVMNPLTNWAIKNVDVSIGIGWGPFKIGFQKGRE